MTTYSIQKAYSIRKNLIKTSQPKASVIADVNVNLLTEIFVVLNLSSDQSQTRSPQQKSVHTPCRGGGSSVQSKGREVDNLHSLMS
ncbi:hypothetical protein DPMN_075330 [Dreissena polymorpha]|uniref:Uncharacterized protein n=1 Tax=Dreissena polymorpha TaxID=45954 RepID=A0A9D4BLF5_DREPO|nr:hypothetical protein DPMN_075330 [Dreissena polymorpha]